MSFGIIRWIVVIPLFLLALLGLGSSFGYGIRLVQIKILPRVPEIVDLIDTALGSTMATDILLSMALSVLLHRGRSGIPRTDRMINTLILYTVNNGLLTSVCALLDVVVHATLPTTFAFLSFYFLLSKLYTNTFLATLNARRSLAGKGEYLQEYTTTFPLSVTDNSNRYAGNSVTVLNADSISTKSAENKVKTAESLV